MVRVPFGKNLASFPGLPHLQLLIASSILETIKSWRCGRPGNEARIITIIMSKRQSIARSKHAVVSYAVQPKQFMLDTDYGSGILCSTRIFLNDL